VVVTLVVAHPDDECMFFSPAMESIRRYCSKNSESLRMTLVCLSTGDAFGLGRVRAKELVGSCRTYEVRKELALCSGWCASVQVARVCAPPPSLFLSFVKLC